jgi:hypothetical protein
VAEKKKPVALALGQGPAEEESREEPAGKRGRGWASGSPGGCSGRLFLSEVDGLVIVVISHVSCGRLYVVTVSRLGCTLLLPSVVPAERG